MRKGPSPTRLPSRRFDGFSVSLIDLPCTGESAFSEKSSGPENLTRPPRPRQIVSAVYHRHLVAPPNLHRSPNRIARNLLNRCHPPIAKGGWHRLNATIGETRQHGRLGHAATSEGSPSRCHGSLHLPPEAYPEWTLSAGTRIHFLPRRSCQQMGPIFPSVGTYFNSILRLPPTGQIATGAPSTAVLNVGSSCVDSLSCLSRNL